MIPLPTSPAIACYALLPVSLATPTPCSRFLPRIACCGNCRPQFSRSKALAGGAAGVEQLAAAVDLGKCLVLSNVDIASLRDPAVLPVLTEAKEAAEAEAAEEGAVQGCVLGIDLGTTNSAAAVGVK